MVHRESLHEARHLHLDLNMLINNSAKSLSFILKNVSCYFCYADPQDLSCRMKALIPLELYVAWARAVFL